MKRLLLILLLLFISLGFMSCKKKTDEPSNDDSSSQQEGNNEQQGSGDEQGKDEEPKKPEFDKDKIVQAGEGTYRVTERTNLDTLAYGIKYIRDLAVSKSPSLITPVTTEDPQVVNVLEIPSSPVLKVVNWTYASRTSWTKQTVRNLAKDFERNNPGWVVLAGINGDFFDINGNGLLPYQTTSASVNNGDVVRAAGNNSLSHSQVGFTNDGSDNSVIGGKTYQTTSYHLLTIYDDKHNVIKEIKIDKINEEPGENEISVYFPYYYWVNQDTKEKALQKVTMPVNNSFIVKMADRAYPNNSKQFYGIGNISKLGEGEELTIGQFGIVSNNLDVTNLLGENVRIRVQQNVIGDYASCDNICGCGVPLVVDGKAPDNIKEITDYRHPRTIVGQKQDGTIFFATIDGRQEASNMYGVSYEEMSALMLYYDCTEGYNLDGGGSTTMILRDKYGEFQVVNSPSDGGNERSDSNALLVVAPGINFSVDSTTNSSATCSYNAIINDVTMSNIKAVVVKDNKETTIDVTSDVFTFNNLEKETKYEVYMTYDIEYKGNKLSGQSFRKSFKTGTDPYKLIDCYYIDTQENYNIIIKIDDPNRTVSRTYLVYGKKRIVLDEISTTYIISKETIGSEIPYLEVRYDLKGDPSVTLNDRIEIKNYNTLS